MTYSSDTVSCGAKDNMDYRFYINVKELMIRQLPRPRLRRKIFVCDGEWLPLITIEANG